MNVPPPSERLSLIQSNWDRLFFSLRHHQHTLDSETVFRFLSRLSVWTRLSRRVLILSRFSSSTTIWGIKSVSYLSLSICTGKTEWDGLLGRQGDGSAIDAFTWRPSTHPIWTLAVHFPSSSQARRTRRGERAWLGSLFLVIS